MNPSGKRLGIIAGNQNLPSVFARQARLQGVGYLVAVAFEGETDPALTEQVDEIEWVKVGQLSKMINALTSRGINQCVMVGQIAPKSLYDIRPDLRAMTMLMKLKEKNAHTIFASIGDELRKDGVELIEATPWLKPLMPGTGFHLGPRLSDQQQADVAFGYRIAKEISRLEIGQSVVVKNGTVLAVEGFEGTDKCVLRGGELAGKEGGAIAVKVAKEGHDLRFDVPCVGPKTVEVCINARVNVFAFEAGRSLVLGKEMIEQQISRHLFTLTTCGQA